jgi:hypothetical protein
LDALIVWHLFLNRQDGMAAFFEENILRDLGLERKVKLARNIAKHWFDEEIDTEKLVRAIAKAKSYRDRIAHWPTRLQPLKIKNGRIVDFRVHMEKGDSTTVLDVNVQNGWLTEIAEARAGLKVLVNKIYELAKSGILDD